MILRCQTARLPVRPWIITRSGPSPDLLVVEPHTAAQDDLRHRLAPPSRHSTYPSARSRLSIVACSSRSSSMSVRRRPSASVRRRGRHDAAAGARARPARTPRSGTRPGHVVGHRHVEAVEQQRRDVDDRELVDARARRGCRGRPRRRCPPGGGCRAARRGVRTSVSERQDRDGRAVREHERQVGAELLERAGEGVARAV